MRSVALVTALVGLTGCQLVFSLEDTGIDAPACATPSGLDNDHDGIDDGCDACVAIGHDDDHDGIDDACDNCPGVANEGQENTTEMMAPGGVPDAVGDACDPRPTQPDVRVEFRSFDEDGANLLWDQVSGVWMFESSGVSAVPNTIVGELANLRTLPEPPYSVAVGVVPASTLDEGGGLFLHLDVDRNSTSNTGVLCGISNFQGVGDHAVVIDAAASDPNNSGNSMMLPAPVMANVPYRIVAEYHPDQEILCSVGISGDETRTFANFGFTRAVPKRELALRAEVIGMRFEYFEVYTPVPP